MKDVDPEKLVKGGLVLWFLTGLSGFLLYGEYTVVDSLYLMAQIITTVGYGDPAAMMPSTTLGYLFMTFFVLMSVIMLAGFATSAVGSLLAQQEALLKSRVDLLTVGTSYHEFGRKHPGMRKLLRAFLVWLSIVIIWIIFFTSWPGEGQTLDEALYMSVITLTTVGFGDKTPKTDVGKVLASVLMLVGSVALADVVAKFSAVFLEAQHEYGLPKLDRSTLCRILEDPHVQAAQQNRMQLARLIAQGQLAAKPKGMVGKADFILYMLKELQMVQPHVLDKLGENFDRLDVDGTGFLDENDLTHGFANRFGSYLPPKASSLSTPGA